MTEIVIPTCAMLMAGRINNSKAGSADSRQFLNMVFYPEDCSKRNRELLANAQAQNGGRLCSMLFIPMLSKGRLFANAQRAMDKKG
ncbi:hypothetical protein SBBP2_660008 [Burkholderiales bacterium]|nr:hypothetical protein SBBP2_660008 [Burkholderiales bacterium]